MLQPFRPPVATVDDPARVAKRLRTLYVRRRQLESKIANDPRKWGTRLRELLAVYREIEHHLVARALAPYRHAATAGEQANRAAA